MLSHLKIHIILFMDIVGVMLLCSMLEINYVVLYCIVLSCLVLICLDVVTCLVIIKNFHIQNCTRSRRLLVLLLVSE